jgi:hypothetical protein
VFREGLRPPDPFREVEPLDAARTQDGMTLRALADLGPVLVVCLPELPRAASWLKRVAARRAEWEREGKRICLVHTGTDDEARAACVPHGLDYVARVADPDRKLYEWFGLGEKRPGLLGRAVGASPRIEPGAFALSRTTYTSETL